MFLNLLGITFIFTALGLLPIIYEIVRRKGQGMKKGIIIYLFFFICSFIFVYWMTPPQNLSSIISSNLTIAFLISLILFFSSPMEKLAGPISGKGVRNFQFKGFGFPAKIPVLILVVGILFAVASAVLRITSINNVYDTIQVKTVSKTEELRSTEETPIAISTASARNKMRKMMSVVPNSNVYDLGTITAQNVDGDYVYVASLEFKGLTKWLKFRESPGYLIISATDINAQPKFVESKMKYIPTAYLNYDAGRKIYSEATQYANVGAVNLEIANDGTPYYVQTLTKEYGISGITYFNRYRVALLNAVTGDVKVYDLKDVPKFVDAPLTSKVAQEMNQFYGKYGDGWWNSFFGQKNVKEPTDNGIYSNGAVTPLLDKKDNLLYFTDFTSPDSSQDSALGYSLIDARTGVLQYYRDKKGMMDSDGAISVASKIYPEKKWKARMPILYNVSGTPTWVISLLDSNGIFKKYVYLSAIDSDILVDGDTAQGTLDAYRTQLATTDSSNSNVAASDLTEFSGVVRRVNLNTNGTTTTVSFLLENEETIFIMNTSNNLYSIFLEIGDTVSFKANVIKGQTTATVEDLTIQDVTPE